MADDEDHEEQDDIDYDEYPDQVKIC